MRRRVTLAAALLACALLVPGCGAEVPKETGDATQDQKVGLQGGWEANTERPASLLSEEQSALVGPALNDGQPDELGRTYWPVSILAQSLADDGSPERVGLLAQAQVGDQVGWYVVTIDFDDTGDNDRPMKYVTEIDPADLYTTDTWEGVFADDGLTVVGSVSQATLSGDAAEAFELARPELEARAAGKVKVHALIASQLVSGTNYLYVVESRPTDGIEDRFSFVVVYRDLDGNVTVTDDAYVDLMSYLEW